METGLALSAVCDRMQPLRKILHGGRELLHCDVGTFYLVTEQGTLRMALFTNDIPMPYTDLPLRDPESGRSNDHFVAVHGATHNRIVVIDDVDSETRYDLSGTRSYIAASGYGSSPCWWCLSPRAAAR